MLRVSREKFLAKNHAAELTRHGNGAWASARAFVQKRVCAEDFERVIRPCRFLCMSAGRILFVEAPQEAARMEQMCSEALREWCEGAGAVMQVKCVRVVSFNS